MKKLIGVISILLFTISNLPAAEMEKTVTLKTETGTLEGTLLKPETDSPVPIALIIAGSGPTDRNGNNPYMTNNSLKMIANDLLTNGIASLRYDKRGVGKSLSAGPKETDLRFTSFVDDAIGWIKFLKQMDGFNQIIIIGHSEGSLIGMIAAQEKEVDKFISLAGAGQSADKVIENQLKPQPAFVLEQAAPILEKLRRGETVEDVNPMLTALFRVSVQPYLISWFSYDPQVEISRLQKPVLIIQGTTDLQVSLNDSDLLYKANQNAEILIIEGMNHVLKPAEKDQALNIQTYNMPDLPIMPKLIEAITAFIK